MQIIVVTGANRGIGKEVTRQLAGKGHQIWATTRDMKNIPEDLAANNVQWVQLDVTSQESIDECVRRITTNTPCIDVLVNNAGIMDHNNLADGDITDIHEVMDINFYGPMRMNQTCLEFLRKSKDPRIINVSSTMGAISAMGTGNAGYRLSKAGLNVQTMILARELDNRIRVNSVCPGWVKTDMGGFHAPENVEEGADSIIWLATAQEIPNGKFIRNRRVIPW